MSHAARKTGATAAAPSGAMLAHIHAARILIVDDDPLICQLSAAILRSHGFANIEIAGGGRAGLDRIRAGEPDLVLLDMRMPDLDGMEVCRQIRANPALADLPILVQTAAVDRTQMGPIFAAGASDFLSKPINPAELIARVSTHVERRALLRELRAYRARTSAELDAARRMQLDLLPDVPTQTRIAEAAGLRLASYFQPSSEIGGDIWGLLPIAPESFGVYLADVVGHGVTAALNTFRLHAIIHEYASLAGDPARLLAVVNQRLARLLAPGQFATFLYVVVEPAEARIRFAAAGAPSPIVADRDTGQAVLTRASGVPLGVIKEVSHAVQTHEFGPRARLILFSDGLSEIPRQSGARWSEEGLVDAVASYPGNLTPQQVVDQLCSAAQIGENMALPDDTTVICMDHAPSSAAGQQGGGNGLDEPR